MGTVYNRGSKGHPNYWVKWKDPSGRWRYKKVGPDRALAKKVLRKIEGDIVSGRHGFEDESAPAAAVGRRRFEELARPWAEGRRKTHRAGKDDVGRMKNHLIPAFGHLALCEVGAKELKAFIASKRGVISPQTTRNCLGLLSRFYNDLIEEGADLVNPVSRLDRATRRAIGPKYDPRKTPFLRTTADIRALYFELPVNIRPMFAVGVFAGLRTGEILALERGDIDLERRLIHVQRSDKGPLKDGDSRFVPIVDALLPVLRAWMMQRGPGSPLFPPERPRRGGKPGSPPRYVRQQTLSRHLKSALRSAKLDDGLTWYQCTRHSFASHWVMNGRPIEKLREILGHESVTTTERYAHLRPEAFSREDYAAISVDLSEGRVVPMEAVAAPPCYKYVTQEAEAHEAAS